MLNCSVFINHLALKGIRFYCGVPDSLLKPFCDYLSDLPSSQQHVIAANEGAAVALASGVYLSTGQPAVVYMQNSGEGNAVNPLVSLADPKVYGIPMLLMIGWRGEPGSKDEPQHTKQGEITISLLETLGIKYEMLSIEQQKAAVNVENAFEYMNISKSPYALVVRKDTFEPYESYQCKANDNLYDLSREDVIRELLRCDEIYGSKSLFVSTTGMTSRELYENRLKRDEGGESDFLTVGSMGHASAIALGIALNTPKRNIICIDGDGAALMHLGTLAIIGNSSARNIKHVLINNGAHDSVGGQPTCGFGIDFRKIAEACGYQKAWLATTLIEVQSYLKQLITSKELCFIEIRVRKGARSDLGRPIQSPQENKAKFMQHLANQK